MTFVSVILPLMEAKFFYSVEFEKESGYGAGILLGVKKWQFCI